LRYHNGIAGPGKGAGGHIENFAAATADRDPNSFHTVVLCQLCLQFGCFRVWIAGRWMGRKFQQCLPNATGHAQRIFIGRKLENTAFVESMFARNSRYVSSGKIEWQSFDVLFGAGQSLDIAGHVLSRKIELTLGTRTQSGSS